MNSSTTSRFDGILGWLVALFVLLYAVGFLIHVRYLFLIPLAANCVLGIILVKHAAGIPSESRLKLALLATGLSSVVVSVAPVGGVLGMRGGSNST
jgi:hypothetical protein